MKKPRFYIEVDGHLHALRDGKPGYEDTLCFYPNEERAKFAASGLNYAAKHKNVVAYFRADNEAIYSYNLKTGVCGLAREIKRRPKTKIPVDLSKAMF